MASSYAFPLRTEVVEPHSNHGHAQTHSHSSVGQRRSGRLAVPFPLPRIPSERLVPQEKASEQQHDQQNVPVNVHRGFGHHRRLYTDGLISPPPEVGDSGAPSSTPHTGLMNGKPRSMEPLRPRSAFEQLDNLHSNTQVPDKSHESIVRPPFG